MGEANEQKDQAGHQFSQEQYDMLKRCSDKRDMTEWNQWREDNSYRDVELDHADLHGCYLVAARLDTWREYRHATPEVYLREASLSEAHLEKAQLCFAHLEGADLHESHLEKCSLLFAFLEGAFLLGAHLDDASLKCAKLQDANLGNAILNAQILKIQNYKGPHLITQI
jgi:uncharacterized protein YjbI with pentapeptide repeats